MRLPKLKNNVDVRRGNGYCCYEVTITYRGKEYRCTSNNSLAWDRIQIKDETLDRVKKSGYTLSQAHGAFYNECLIKNHL